MTDTLNDCTKAFEAYINTSKGYGLAFARECWAAAWKAAKENSQINTSVDEKAIFLAAQRAHDNVQVQYRECKQCNGAGREEDNTPCGDPNEAAICYVCKGRGRIEIPLGLYDRLNAAFEVIRPYLAQTKAINTSVEIINNRDGLEIMSEARGKDFKCVVDGKDMLAQTKAAVNTSEINPKHPAGITLKDTFSRIVLELLTNDVTNVETVDALMRAVQPYLVQTKAPEYKQEMVDKILRTAQEPPIGSFKALEEYQEWQDGLETKASVMGDERAVNNSMEQEKPDTAPEAAGIESGCSQPSPTSALNDRQLGFNEGYLEGLSDARKYLSKQTNEMFSQTLIEELKQLYLEGGKQESSLAGRCLNYIADLKQQREVPSQTLNGSARAALVNLVELKKHKQQYGETEYYKTNEARAWEIAAKIIADEPCEILLITDDDFRELIYSCVATNGYESYSERTDAIIKAIQPYLKREYRPHPDTKLSVRIKNAIHALNLNRPDIAALPDGATITTNITSSRTIGALLEDILTYIEGAALAWESEDVGAHDMLTVIASLVAAKAEYKDIEDALIHAGYIAKQINSIEGGR